MLAPLRSTKFPLISVKLSFQLWFLKQFISEQKDSKSLLQLLNHHLFLLLFNYFVNKKKLAVMLTE